jgi:hypothetical protein
LGNAGSPINLELLPEYLPKQDHFSAFSVDYVRDMFSNGSNGFLQLRTRHYNQLSKFDTNAIAFGFESPWRINQWALRSTVMTSLLTLDQKLYQKQSMLQLLVTPPLSLPPNMQLSILGSVTRALYPSSKSFDANTSEIRSLLTAQTGAAQWKATAGWMLDQGKDSRLGGDRNGWAASLQVKTRLADQMFGSVLFGEFSWNRQLWQSKKIYAPGLIDYARRQDTEVFRLALSLPVNQHHTIQGEIRNVLNRENISLFNYNSRLFQLSWQWIP